MFLKSNKSLKYGFLDSYIDGSFDCSISGLLDFWTDKKFDIFSSDSDFENFTSHFTLFILHFFSLAATCAEPVEVSGLTSAF
jgi:hypothetical protein